MVRKIVQFVQRRKFFSFVVFLFVGIGLYYGFQKYTKKPEAVRYVLAPVEKGTLISSVSGSGQIAVSNQVDVKAKSSGEITSILVKNGQSVKTGDILVQVNARDAIRAVQDAKTNLESATLSFDKLKASINDSTITQSENAVAAANTNLQKLKLSQEINYQKALEATQKATDAVEKGYEDTFTTVSNIFLDLPNVITSLHDILLGDGIGKNEYTVGSNESNTSALINSTDPTYQSSVEIYQKSAESSYRSARMLFDANFSKYKTLTRISSFLDIENLLIQTIETTRSMSDAAKSELNYFDTWADYRTAKNRSIFSIVKTYQSNLATLINQVNADLTTLLSLQRTLKDNKEALVNANRSIKEMEQNNPLDLFASQASLKEKQDSLETLKKGVDPLDIRSAQITINQRQLALSDAREKLVDYTLRALFDGVIAKVDLRKGDQLSSGATVATLITSQKLATISLNEIDVAKIKVGQKVIFTFDAVSGLTISGEVGEVDQLGTVSQGVVSYNVKILFDTQDEKIKSGMTVSASIIIDMKSDVLLVPNSAIKSQGDINFVEVLTDTASSLSGNSNSGSLGVTSATGSRQQMVEIGIANDTSTEIISGLKEGDQVVVRTITPTTAASSVQAPSLLGGTGTRSLNSGGGGNFRQTGR